jgi:hypothetical protein
MFEYSGQFGMAGSIVAAILQASGLLSLQNILFQADIYLSALGSLLFVAGVIVFITKFAIDGNARQAILVLLGPTLALVCMFTTVKVLLKEPPAVDKVTLESGVLAFFGEEQDLKDIRVPLFIVLVNRVTSSVVKQLSDLILSDKLKDATVRAARDRLMSRILSAEHGDSSFRMLLTLSLTGDCAEITSNDWELGREKYRGVPPDSLNGRFAEQLRAKRDALAQKRHSLDKSVLDSLIAIGLTPNEKATCNEIWLYTRELSFKVADEMLSNASQYRAEFPELNDAEWLSALTQVKEKLSTSNANAAELTAAYRVLAAFILRNTFSKSAHGSLTGRIASHSDWMLERSDEGDWDLEGLNDNVNGIRRTIVRFAAAIPYVQGLCMYLLLISFPFFCLLMIFPQKIGALVTWASLWLWLLSWEIGFAIVSLVKDILWTFIPNIGDELLASQTGGLPVTRLSEVNWDDPANMFNLLTAAAPEQHFQTYYGLIAALTLSVPIVTGYCFQAAGQLTDIIQRAWTPGGGKGR